MSREACHGILSTGCLWLPSAPDAAALAVGFFPFSVRLRKTDIWDGWEQRSRLSTVSLRLE